MELAVVDICGGIYSKSLTLIPGAFVYLSIWTVSISNLKGCLGVFVYVFCFVFWL